MAMLKITYISKAVNTNMEFYALIPQKKHIRSLDSPELHLNSFKEMYPVTILLHDMHSSPGELIRRTRLEEYADRAGQLILLPQGYLSYYTDYALRDDGPTPLNPATGTSGDFSEMRYGTYIIPELLDYAQAVLPVSASPKDVSIGGIGMGGFGAMKLGSMHQNRVGFVFSIDGHVDLQWLMDHSPSQKEQFEAIFGSLRAEGPDNLTAAWSFPETHLPLFQSWQENGANAQMNRNFAEAINHKVVNCDAVNHNAVNHASIRYNAGTCNPISQTDPDVQTEYCCFPDNAHYGWDYIDNALALALSWTSRLNEKER